MCQSFFLSSILENSQKTRKFAAMIHYIQLLRPLQWLKNIFVFAPIFFSNNLLKPDYFWPTLVVFASFCMISSSIYCFNDLRDVEADRQHPKKCHRPIASGKVSVRGGYAMMLLCTIASFALIPLAIKASETARPNARMA